MSPLPRPRRRPSTQPVHPVDAVPPPGRLAVYGLQHVLAFYAGAVVVPILLANAIGLDERQLIHLINADLFTCGIASIIQAVGIGRKIGVRLPLLQGVTFTAVSPMIAIGLAAGGGTEGLTTIYGAVIVAGLVTFFAAPYVARLLRFFPPVVTGTVITVIGLALLPVAAQDAVGGANAPDPGNPLYLALALGTLAVIVLIQRIFRGFLATVAVLAGLVIGTLAAVPFGLVDTSGVGESAWVGVTTPFHFGWPQFSLAAILSMIVVMMITAVETTGDVVATGEIVGKRVGPDDVARALRADGAATTLGGVLNSFPYTCFAENVGLVRLTRVSSRWVVAAAGGFMILIGLVPKAGALVAAVPHPVLGGAALAMFATVAVVGIQTLTAVDFRDHRNVVVVGSGLGVALFVTVQPDVAQALPGWAQIVLGSGITAGSVVAIGLNLLFFHTGRRPAGDPVPAGIAAGRIETMGRAEFADVFGRLFEGPTPVPARVHARGPFPDTDALRAAVQEELFAAPAGEQRELMGHYPDLGGLVTGGSGTGAGPDGRAPAGRAGQGTGDTAGDTAGDTGGDALGDRAVSRDRAGLALLGADDRDELAALAASYRERFGFPLIVCLRDAGDRAALLATARRRLTHPPAQEHAAALVEIAKVAGHRFDDLVAR
ncbi:MULTISPECIES: solute carrier family 23 protein [unclassified Pseudonocardia]|uniref:solute carrier family 23 protein n=1 Tax=unclassified Pseudonocardia TaxID=2619320 RepID=UPI00094B10A0|nr:solute carrier family 23 protein [Pseudonocardia sp. Ae707_Ps1]OLM18337.1 Xanthine permease [Pseudonocardia sp. Ae707_Ps1]